MWSLIYVGLCLIIGIILVTSSPLQTSTNFYEGNRYQFLEFNQSVFAEDDGGDDGGDDVACLNSDNRRLKITLGP